MVHEDAAVFDRAKEAHRSLGLDDTVGSANGWWRRMLVHRHWPRRVTLLAVVLTLPALRSGFVADDYFHRTCLLPMREFPELIHHPLDLFAFSYGDPQRVEALMDRGIAPWWTLPELKMAFCRPLSSLTHWLDYLIWPNSPVLMHAQNLFWFAVAVAGAAVFFRRLFGVSVVAGLAALLFAVDDAHATPAGWIAGRNTLVAAAFGLWCLVAHDRWRRSNWRAGAVIAPLLFLLSLLSAEAGVATLAYLVPHAVFLERNSIRRRLVGLSPYVALLLVWRTVWALRGYGVAGVGAYVDPLGAPLRFAAAVLDVGPVLLLGQWALPPSDMYALYDVLWAGSARIIWLLAIVFLGFIAWVLHQRVRRTPEVNFCISGMLLALLPICATVDFPMDRLLLFVGIGATGLLAMFLQEMAAARQRVRSGQARPPGWRTSMALAVVFVIVHLIVAPIALVARAAAPAGPAVLTDQFYLSLPDEEVSSDQDIVVVNAPSCALVGMFPVMQAVHHRPLPRFMRMLGPSQAAVTLTRVDERTIRIFSADGWLAQSYDHLLRGPDERFSAGHRIELSDMVLEVSAVTPDGRPQEVVFTFAAPLESPAMRWLQWQNGTFVPFALPEIGHSTDLPSPQPEFKLWSTQRTTKK